MRSAKLLSKSLLKVILIVATVGAGADAATPNVKLDESVRSDAPSKVARHGRRNSTAKRQLRDTACGAASPPAKLRLDGEVSAQTFVPADLQSVEARTCYGAGSFAGSALGTNASRPWRT